MAHGDPLVGRIAHDALGCSALAISKMAAVKPLGVSSSGTRLVFFLVTVDIYNTNLPRGCAIHAIHGDHLVLGVALMEDVQAQRSFDES
jgi:hypothetical protein